MVQIPDWITALVAVAAFVLSMQAYSASSQAERTTRRLTLLQRVHALSDRLYDIDKLMLGHPEVQQFIHDQVHRTKAYFGASGTRDALYFKVKAAVYMQLNYFDELVSTVQGNKELEQLMEFATWKRYMLRKMRHPLFKELFCREKEIWGAKFAKLIKAEHEEINQPADQDMF